MTSFLLLVSLLLSATASSESFEFWPGAHYDPAVPSFENVFSHGPGEAILSPYPPCIGFFSLRLCAFAPLRSIPGLSEAQDAEEHVANHRSHDAHGEPPQQELIEELRAVLVDGRRRDAERSKGR